MPKFRRAEVQAKLDELSVLLKMYDIHGKCIYSREKPEMTRMTGGWRAYPFRIGFRVSVGLSASVKLQVERGNAFATLKELEARVHEMTNTVTRG